MENGDFSRVKAVLLDLDGTIYLGEELIEGAINAIAHCRSCGKRVFFLTNNSAKSQVQVYEKLMRIGISCSLEEVFNTSFISTLFVQQKGFKDIYLCGTRSLRQEFESAGIPLVGESEAKTVLIGFDPEFSYEKCTNAVRAALRADTLIACNRERAFPGEGGLFFPGCGAMVAAIEHCSSRKIDYLVGKPSTLLLEVLCSEFHYRQEDILMVGDTYESDILMAKNFGCPSVLIGSEVYDDTTCIKTIGCLMELI